VLTITEAMRDLADAVGEADNATRLVTVTLPKGAYRELLSELRKAEPRTPQDPRMVIIASGGTVHIEVHPEPEAHS
jgi:hypothetical protein